MFPPKRTLPGHVARDLTLGWNPSALSSVKIFGGLHCPIGTPLFASSFLLLFLFPGNFLHVTIQRATQIDFVGY